MQQKNHQVVLTRPLSGVPLAEDFRVQAVPIPEPGPGELLIRHIYLSRWIRISVPRLPVAIWVADSRSVRAPCRWRRRGLGQVLWSRNPACREGDYVRHFGGWQEYALSSGEQIEVLDRSRAPLSTWLGVLGMPGLTAWASMVGACRC